MGYIFEFLGKDQVVVEDMQQKLDESHETMIKEGVRLRDACKEL